MIEVKDDKARFVFNLPDEFMEQVKRYESELKSAREQLELAQADKNQTVERAEFKEQTQIFIDDHQANYADYLTDTTEEIQAEFVASLFIYLQRNGDIYPRELNKMTSNTISLW